MGNNNTSPILTEEESSKLESNGMSSLESVSVETTHHQVFLASEGRDGDGEKEKESLPDGKLGNGSPERESQSNELVENVEEEMHQSGLERLVMETDEQLHKEISVEEGVEPLCEVTEVEVTEVIGTQSVVTKLNTTTEFGIEEKSCVIDEIVFVSPSFYETVGTEENMSEKSLEERDIAEEVVKLDQETSLEQTTGVREIEPQEIMNLDYRIVDDGDDEVTNEGKADQVISEPGLQDSNAIQETGFEVYKEEKDMELGREASLKRMSRCRSLPVSQTIRVMEDSLVQKLVSEVAFPSRNKLGLEKANTSETLIVSCVGSNKAQETTEAETESNKETRLEMRSPSFGNDLRIEERREESTEKTPLLCQDKTETYEATIDVEEKTVMLKRSESEKTRGFELSLGLSMKPIKRSEADDSLKETKGSGDNLLDKKASLGSTKVRVRKRSKSSLFGACLCCTIAMN